MDGIQLMMEEHDNILTVLSAIRKHSVQVMEGAALCTEDFRDMIHFARGYADKHHHGKEEQLLFNEMEDRLGSAGEKLIRNGMLVEHDLGRLHIAELEKALNQYEQDPSAENRLAILAEAYGYAACCAVTLIRKIRWCILLLSVGWSRSCCGRSAKESLTLRSANKKRARMAWHFWKNFVINIYHRRIL